MSPKRITEIITEVNELKSEHLQSVKVLRDKFYAHNDKNKYKIDITLTLQNAWKILEKLQTIFIEINLNFRNEQIIFSLFSSKPGEIDSLHKLKLIQEMILAELAKSPDLGKSQKARDILQNRKPA